MRTLKAAAHTGNEKVVMRSLRQHMYSKVGMHAQRKGSEKAREDTEFAHQADSWHTDSSDSKK